MTSRGPAEGALDQGLAAAELGLVQPHHPFQVDLEGVGHSRLELGAQRDQARLDPQRLHSIQPVGPHPPGPSRAFQRPSRGPVVYSS